MLYLDRPSRKLEIVLAGAVTTNQWDITSQFFDLTPQTDTTERRGGTQKATSNDTTDVTIVDAVAVQGRIRNVHTLTLHNRDTVSSTVTVKYDDSGTETILIKQSVAAGESLTYEDNAGWQLLSPVTAPFVDTTPLVKGSVNSTKLLRVEVDGLTASTTRTWTAQDADGTVALTNNKLSAFAATTSAELAGVVSDETGSGSLVFGTGPTISGATTGSTVAMGTGSGTGTHVVVANVQTTTVGNVGGGTDDLMSYSLPANSLSANGKSVRVTAWGAGANNANGKTLGTTFGTGVSSVSLDSSVAIAWRLEMVIIRTGSNAQKIFLTSYINTGAVASANQQGFHQNLTATQTDTGAITIKFTAAGVADNDITQHGMLVEFLN